MSKQKGSYWERKFVEVVSEQGLPAHRVPHSGAMRGYPDDVVVCDDWRAECKYRREGEGFKRLHEWLGSADALLLPKSGLIVYRFDFWTEIMRARVDGTALPRPKKTVTKDVTEQATMLGWFNESAHFLALRKRNSAWLVAERI